MNTNFHSQTILNFLKTQILGVVSTIDSQTSKPESALVAFSETDNLEIIFGTFNDTRKVPNILKNPHISFVVGFGDVTVQYEGTAKFTEGEEEKKCRDTHLAKNPASKKYAFDPKQRFLKVSPTWIRYSDLSSTPETIFEISF